MDRNTIVRAVLRLGLRLFALLAVYGVLHTTGLHRFTSYETEGLNTLILLVGSIYAVILAFTIFVIWGQFTDVENWVILECNSLSDLLRFSGYVSAEMDRTVRKGVTAYAQQVVRQEWPALGEGRRDKRAQELFNDLLTAVIAGDGPRDECAPERPAHARLIEIARRAGERRDGRVTRSLTRIPPTMFWFLNTIAGVLLLLVFVYPFHHAAVGASCLGVLAVVLLLAHFVMSDMDNPLQGAWNVSPRPFAELSR